MSTFLERTEILLGAEEIDRLQRKSIFVAGIGGVGSFAVEILVRAGFQNIYRAFP